MALQLVLVTASMAVGVSALGVLAQIWRRGQVWRRPALTLMAVGSALYAFAYAVELAGDSVPWVLATYRVQYLAIALAPTLVLWLAADVTGAAWLRGRAWRAFVLAVTVATWFVVATNPLHDLYHAHPRMDEGGAFPVIVFERGPWYWAFQGFAGVAVLVANAAFLGAWRSNSEPRRSQARLLFFASVIPWVGSLVNLSGALPLDVMPFTLLATSVLLYRGVVHRGMSDLAPVARDLVFERMADAAVVLDPSGHVLDQNEAAVVLLGPLAERFGHAGPARLAEQEPALAGAIVASAVSGDPSGGRHDVSERGERTEVVLAGRTYSLRSVDLEARGRRLGRVLVLREITRYVEMEALLRTLATTDELTGIANRRHFLDLAARDLEQARRHGRAITLVVFDLDRFKRINDTFGHQVGDAVLRAVAATAVAALRTADVVGRFGGEEFAVCLPDTDEQRAGVVAERLRAEIGAIVLPVGDTRITISASFGCCTVVPPDPTSLDAALARADLAQYEAKSRGGDLVVACRSTPGGAVLDVGARPA